MITIVVVGLLCFVAGLFVRELHRAHVTIKKMHRAMMEANQ